MDREDAVHEEMLQEFAKVCEGAARQGGERLVTWMGRFEVQSKGPADFVTQADFASQEVIRNRILEAFPTHSFLGEEAPVDRRELGEYCWVVDPLDGTMNYVHGLRHFCVSVALERNGELLVGTIFDPLADECFTAIRGEGATLNGDPIRAVTKPDLNDAMVAVSFPPCVKPDSPHLREFAAVATRCQSVRRMGSSALNLAYVAAGRLGGFWARETRSWDVAAGVLLVREAGGMVTGLGGKEFDLHNPAFVAAGNAPLHAALLQTIEQV